MALAAQDGWVERVLGITLRATPRQDTFSTVAFEKIHLTWDANKKVVEQRLATLHGAIVGEFDDADGQTAANTLSKILANLNEGFGDTLDEFRNADTPERRLRLATQAREIAQGYRDYLEADELIQHVEANPFEIDVGVRDLMSTPLMHLEAELTKAGL